MKKSIMPGAVVVGTLCCVFAACSGSSDVDGDSADSGTATDATGDVTSSSDAAPSDAAPSDAAPSDGSQATDANAADAGALTAPRLIAPLSTSRVTTRQPTLRWLLPTGVADVTLDLCHDRTCTDPIGTPTHVTGSSFKLTADLPVGVVFWRVHPQGAAVASATWQFNVPARSAPIDTSWGTTLDVNGDGYSDLAVADDPAGLSGVYVYLGGPDGLGAATPAIGSDAGVGSQFGDSIASAGDLNGDGYSDLAVSDTNRSAIHVYFGGPTAVSADRSVEAQVTILDGGVPYAFARSLAAAGDVDGDGYGDLVVGNNGSIYVFRGDATGILTTPATSITGVANSFGERVTGAGDLNGDGFADIAVSSAASEGKVFIYNGSATGIASSSAPQATLVGSHANDFGGAVACAGDLNADGYADVVVGASTAPADGGSAGSSGRAYVYFGGATGIDSSTTTLLAFTGYGGQFGGSAAAAGDVNGDGYSDVVIGAPGTSGSEDAFQTQGSLFVYLGNHIGKGVTTQPDTQLSKVTDFGALVAGAGDTNRDGYSDIATGQSYGTVDSVQLGLLFIYAGSDAGIGATPSATFVGRPGNHLSYPLQLAGSTN